MARSKATKKKKGTKVAAAAATRRTPAKFAKIKMMKQANMVKNNQKNSSDYGRISFQLQQPKGTKWNLPANMGGGGGGGGSADSRRKKFKNSQKKISFAKGGVGNQNQKPNHKKTSKKQKFVLNMPVVSQSHPVVPWLSSGKGTKRDQSPPSRNPHHSANEQPLSSSNVRLGHNLLTLPAAALHKLNKELEAFANYVRLSDDEVAARRAVVEHIQTQCCHLFGVRPETCQVFGSFASLPVCTFTSDVDMAIHDVVPSPATGKNTTTATVTYAEQQKEEQEFDDDDVTPKRATKRKKIDNRSPHPNLKRQERVLKWKAVLDEVEEKKQDMEDEYPSMSSALVGTSAEHPIVILEEHSSSSPAKKTCAQELIKSRPLPSSAEPDQEGLPLFVIDRVGCPDEFNIDDNPQVAVDPQTTEAAEAITAARVDTDAPTVTDASSSKDLSVFDDVDENDDEEVDTDDATNYPTQSRVTDPARRLEDSDDEDSVRPRDGYYDDNGHESDADSADKLAALRDRLVDPPDFHEHHTIRGNSDRDTEGEGSSSQDDDDDEEQEEDAESSGQDNEDDAVEQDEKLKTVESRSRSHSVISLCSATTCSDTEENKEWDDSGLEVSFHSTKAASSRRNDEHGEFVGPTGETRVKVVRALNSLSRRLRGSGVLSNQIHVRKWAKVPIINMETWFGFECDIAIGGHNGVDTSSYASSQCSRFESFSTVVLVLKILLNQHDLDKPFTGGLGSFKLYVLVASHIEKHLKLGGNDNAAEILITFLLRYGVPSHKMNTSVSKLLTPLCNDTVIKSGGQGYAEGVADMGGVFQLENCLLVFQACYHKLQDKLQNCSKDPLHSILGYIVDSRWLKSMREKGQIDKGAVVLYKTLSNASAVRGNKRNSDVRTGRKRLWDEYALDTDDEAEQLKARYGVRGSAAQKPKSRAPRSSTKKMRGRGRPRQN